MSESCRTPSLLCRSYYIIEFIELTTLMRSLMIITYVVKYY